MQVGEQVHEVGCDGVSTETPVEGVQPLTVDDPHVDVVALRVIRSASDGPCEAAHHTLLVNAE